MNFNKLPLNTQRTYTMEKDKSGCEVYIPVINRDNDVIDIAKKKLFNFLKNQPEPHNMA